MLANGAKLGYKTSELDYKDLPGLKEIPDMGVDPEKVENTCLTDKNKQYEQGIGDPGDLKYKFKYENKSAQSSYRVLKALADAKTVVDWKETLHDGTATTFKGQCSVKRTGGGVNGVIEFELGITIASDITVVDPA